MLRFPNEFWLALQRVANKYMRILKGGHMISCGGAERCLKSTDGLLPAAKGFFQLIIQTQEPITPIKGLKGSKGMLQGARAM